MAKRSKSRTPCAVVSAGSQELRLFSIPGIPEIRPGNDLVKCLTSAARRAAIHFAHGDILVVAQNCFKGGRRPGSARKRKDFAGGPRARCASEKGSSRDR